MVLLHRPRVVAASENVRGPWLALSPTPRVLIVRRTLTLLHGAAPPLGHIRRMAAECPQSLHNVGPEAGDRGCYTRNLMETERATLVQQVLAGIASLDGLDDAALSGAASGVPPALARLSTAELEAVAVSLAILVEGAHHLESAEDGGRG